MDNALRSTSMTPARPRRRRPLRARATQLLALLIAVAVIVMLASRMHTIDWSAVESALRAYHATTLLLVALLTAGSYLAASCYDLVGRRYTGHQLPTATVFSINAIAYAFALNLGALLGGWAFRFRLYRRLQLRAPRIAQIIVLSVITNWSGFFLLAGLVFSLAPPPLPDALSSMGVASRSIGIALLLLVIAYLGACAFGGPRQWTLRIRRVELPMPELRIALIQLLLSSLNWLLMAAALATLLPDDLPYTQVLAALCVGSVAGLILRVPGGVGVLEAGVAQMLSSRIDAASAVAAVLAFRAIYYLVPLVIAALGYAGLERMMRTRRRLLRGMQDAGR